MFGVVWGHTISSLGGGNSSCSITWFLRLYDMPFFMLISGHFLSYSIKKYSLKKILLDKVTTILIPTLFWGLLLSRGHSWNGGYYFLCAIFFSSVIVILIEKLIHSSILKWTVYSLIILGLYLIDQRLFNLCFLFPFFLLGYKNDWWYKKLRIVWVFLFLLGICFWKNTYSIWNADTNILHGLNVVVLNLYRIILSCAALATMRMLFDMVYMYFKTNSPSQIGLISKTIGRETLGLYISHVFILRLLKIGVKYLQGRIGFNPFLWNERLLVFVLAVILSLIIIWGCFKFIEISKRSRILCNLWGFKLMS